MKFTGIFALIAITCCIVPSGLGAPQTSDNLNADAPSASEEQLFKNIEDKKDEVLNNISDFLYGLLQKITSQTGPIKESLPISDLLPSADRFKYAIQVAKKIASNEIGLAIKMARILAMPIHLVKNLFSNFKDILPKLGGISPVDDFLTAQDCTLKILMTLPQDGPVEIFKRIKSCIDAAAESNKKPASILTDANNEGELLGAKPK